MAVLELSIKGHEGVKLEGILAESPQSDLLVILSPGLISSIKDYKEFVEKAADRFSVLGYSLRGHAGSEGSINYSASVLDLERIIQYAREDLQAGRIGLMAHSIGAAISKGAIDRDEESKILALYAMAAYPSVMHTKHARSLKTAKAIKIHKLPRLLDKALIFGARTLAKSIGKQNYTDGLRLDSFSDYITYVDDAAFSSKSMNVPLEVVLSSGDNDLGLESKERQYAFRQFFTNPEVFRESFVRFYGGLNHCFNIGTYVPFAAAHTPSRFYEEVHSFFRDNILEK